MIPDLSNFDYDQCIALRTQIDERLDAIRDEFVAKAGALGLSLTKTNGHPKRRKKTRAANGTVSHNPQRLE